MSKTLKPITELTNEQLLNLVQNNKKEIHTFDYSNDVLDFVSVYSIKEGKNRVLFPLIYGLYKKYSKKPLANIPFGKELCKLFPSIKHSKSTIYLINKPKEYFLEKSVKKTINKTKRKRSLKHFQGFVDYYQLKTGRFYVKDIVLYNLYDKWTYKNYNRNSLSYKQFLNFCRLFFNKPKIKIYRRHEWFSMDGNIQNHLNTNLLELMKQK